MSAPQGKRPRSARASTQLNEDDFTAMVDELKHYDEQREKVIKRSRDIQKLSKQAIYSLHRGAEAEANARLTAAEQAAAELLPVIEANPTLRPGSFSNSLEEYAEAVCLRMYCAEGRLPTRGEMALPCSVEEYLGGALDFAGELNRYAIARATVRDREAVQSARDLVEALQGQFLRMDLRNGSLRKKYDALKYTLKKLENTLYELALTDHGLPSPEDGPEPAAEALAADKEETSSSEAATSSSSGTSSSSAEEVSGASPGTDRFQTPGNEVVCTPAAAARGEGGAPSAEAPAQRSRSARRKAAKRRLRRLGVLPKTAGKRKASAEDGIAEPFSVPFTAVHRKKACTEGHEEPVRVHFGEESSDEEVLAVAVPHAPQSAVNVPAQRELEVEPMTDAVFNQLVPVPGMPGIDDVVAYKLLEIGPSFEPQVSEVRLGKVVATDADEGSVVLQPWPHPLSARQPEAQGWGDGELQEQDEDDDDMHPPSNYDAMGVLRCERSTFFDLRQAHGDRQPTGASDPSAAPAPDEDLGPSRYSKLGPPRPATASMPPSVLQPEGGWTSLVSQLQRRREELLLKGRKAENAAEPAMQSKEVRRSGGVRARRSTAQSALGPMLRMLRGSNQLGSS